MAVRHPERVTAIISQNGNAYVEGLSDGWNPIRAYWQDPSEVNRAALRAFLSPDTTIWQYTHGVAETSLVSPDGYSLDNYYLARPSADEVRLDLFGDYKTNVAMYPEFQAYFRKHKPVPGGLGQKRSFLSAARCGVRATTEILWSALICPRKVRAACHVGVSRAPHFLATFAVRFPALAFKFPDLRNIFPVKLHRELSDKCLWHSGLLLKNLLQMPQNRKIPC
jgi:hypothetical protein